jgi:phosphodiesterase/alkaline phosphatase D-like protein
MRPTPAREARPPLLVEAVAAPAGDFTVKLRLQLLRPGTRYRYAVTQGAVAVDGEFVSAPAPGSPARVRLSWSGDLGSRAHCRHVTAGYPIFRALAHQQPDLFLFVGDTVYADHICEGPDRVRGSDFRAVSLKEFWAKHRYNRADASVQAFFRRTAVYAIWDDHDVRNDFAGPTEPLMPVGRQAFLDYFPIVPPAEEPGRLYRRFRWGGALEVFILDTRQYRSRNTDPTGRTRPCWSRAAALAARGRARLDGHLESGGDERVALHPHRPPRARLVDRRESARLSRARRRLCDGARRGARVIPERGRPEPGLPHR